MAATERLIGSGCNLADDENTLQGTQRQSLVGPTFVVVENGRLK
jgi:hypothetical protein